MKSSRIIPTSRTWSTVGAAFLEKDSYRSCLMSERGYYPCREPISCRRSNNQYSLRALASASQNCIINLFIDICFAPNRMGRRAYKSANSWSNDHCLQLHIFARKKLLHLYSDIITDRSLIPKGC